MQRRRTIGPLAVAGCLLAACSSGDEPSLADPVDAPDVAEPPTTATVESSQAGPAQDTDEGDGEFDGATDALDPTTEPSDPADTGPSDGAPPETAPSETAPPETAPPETATPETAPIETVPVTGIPGLDSDDAFCAAWSRFGGTWQVLVVGSTFLEDPAEVARWEIAAAPVIEEAYRDLTDAFPAVLAEESEVALDAYFGALARRSAAATDTLAAAGATDGQLAELAERWIAALGTRSNDSPAVVLEVGPDLDPLLATAASEFREQRVPIHTDPSMFVTAETPATDAFIANNCPDQGTLAGVEVDP